MLRSPILHNLVRLELCSDEEPRALIPSIADLLVALGQMPFLQILTLDNIFSFEPLIIDVCFLISCRTTAHRRTSLPLGLSCRTLEFCATCCGQSEMSFRVYH